MSSELETSLGHLKMTWPGAWACNGKGMPAVYHQLKWCGRVVQAEGHSLVMVLKVQMTVQTQPWSLTSVTPALGGWSQEDPWSSLANQAATPVSSKVRRDIASKTKVRWDSGRSQPAAFMCMQTYVHTSTHVPMQGWVTKLTTVMHKREGPHNKGFLFPT